MSDAQPLQTMAVETAFPTAPESDAVVVWHRRGLRTQDHPAVAAAAEYEAVLPLFIFDPSFYSSDGLACDARIQFLHESLDDLAEQYSGLGGQLNYGHGDPVEIPAKQRHSPVWSDMDKDPSGSTRVRVVAGRSRGVPNQ